MTEAQIDLEEAIVAKDGAVQTYAVTLYGTITRDIRRFAVDAKSEDEARKACAKELPMYRVHSVDLMKDWPAE